jgi:RNA polymerase sigma-70 factor (ECF subfamily)
VTQLDATSSKPRLSVVGTDEGDATGRRLSREAAGAGPDAGAVRPPPSFDELYRTHYRRVLGLCRRLLGRRAEQAEDATQEVFMRAYRGFGTYDRSQPFAAWVLTIASNHCVDLVRRGARDARIFGDEAVEQIDLESDDPGAVAELISAERAVQVKAAIDALPDKLRLPLVLAYYNESSYDAIAATLGITRNHVGILILRGKQALRRSLEPRIGESA